LGIEYGLMTVGAKPAVVVTVRSLTPAEGAVPLS
jgi:hypothetical protein